MMLEMTFGNLYRNKATPQVNNFARPSKFIHWTLQLRMKTTTQQATPKAFKTYNFKQVLQLPEKN